MIPWIKTSDRTPTRSETPPTFCEGISDPCLIYFEGAFLIGRYWPVNDFWDVEGYGGRGFSVRPTHWAYCSDIDWQGQATDVPEMIDGLSRSECCAVLHGNNEYSVGLCFAPDNKWRIKHASSWAYPQKWAVCTHP